jgi:hypothetical protein
MSTRIDPCYAVEFFSNLWRGPLLEASQPYKDETLHPLLAEWAATSSDSKRKQAAHLLRKLLRLKPLAR